MAITARPAASFEATLTGAPSGLAGTLGVQILDNIGGVSLPRSTAGIIETPAGSGLYAKTLTAPAVAGQYTILWDIGSITPSTTATEDLTITASLVAGPATTYYCLPDDLRAELAVDNTALADTAAVKIIQDAEDVIDAMLGAWPTDITTGRKATHIGAFAWQTAKLQRATVKVAARIYAKPDLFTERQYQSIKGPDFAFSGPLSGLIGTEPMRILQSSGLLRLTTHATPRIDQRGLGYLSGNQIANGPDEYEDADVPAGFSGDGVYP